MSKLSTFAKRIYVLLESLLVVLVGLIPKRLVVRFKSKVQIIGKMDYSRRDVFMHVDSEIDYQTRLKSCSKEPETIAWIESFLKPGQVFYDIGANVGAYSLVASKFLDGDIKVYAFEPGFITYAQLCKNILLNDCQDAVVPIQVALSDKTGMDIFNYQNLIPGGALHTLGEAIDYQGNEFQPVAKQPVLAYKIDGLIELFELPVPNHIKIDVDGIEFKILKGAEETLQNPLVNSVILEMNGDAEAMDEVISFMSGKGFAVDSRHYHELADTFIFARVHD